MGPDKTAVCPPHIDRIDVGVSESIGVKNIYYSIFQLPDIVLERLLVSVDKVGEALILF